jgi:hypothetical protein
MLTNRCPTLDPRFGSSTNQTLHRRAAFDRRFTRAHISPCAHGMQR